jgi:hypothetical protein
MTALDVGEKVKVRYVDDRTYTLDVEVTAIRPPNAFIGRVEAIFLPPVGEITSGQTFDELTGQEKTFENEDILKRRTDLP